MQYYKYKKYNVRIRLGKYPNGRLALELRTKNGEPVCVPTVNIPGRHYYQGKSLSRTGVKIKEYSAGFKAKGLFRSPNGNLS